MHCQVKQEIPFLSGPMPCSHHDEMTWHGDMTCQYNMPSLGEPMGALTDMLPVPTAVSGCASFGACSNASPPHATYHLAYRELQPDPLLYGPLNR